jgi:predicted metal-binding membrane protein
VTGIRTTVRVERHQSAAMRAISSPRLFLPFAIALIAAAWIALWAWDSSPYARYLHHVEWSETGLAALCRLAPAAPAVIAAILHVAAWLLMIVAMMLPTTLPLLAVFGRLTAARPGRGRLMLLVILGYVAAWSAFGLIAHVADAGLHALMVHTPWLAWHGWFIGAMVLGAAGAYQFSSLKYRCLDKCHSALVFVSERWHGGNARRDSFLLGVRHGMFCVGCCWTLMSLMFVIGVGSVGWMLALGAVMAAEKNLPWGRRLSAPIGAALLSWGGLIAINGLWQV